MRASRGRGPRPAARNSMTCCAAHAVVRSASGLLSARRGAQEEVASVGEGDLPAVDGRCAVLGEEALDDDLRPGNEVALSQAAS
mgnify:CR=1 FL=1